MRVLLVDSDDSIQNSVSPVLRRRGFHVRWVGAGAVAVAVAPDVDLILLELELPDLDGVEVCRQVRHRSRVPIVMFSAVANEAAIVLSLHAGADDYIVKPCREFELLARVEANARRARWTAESDPPAEDDGIALGELVISPRSRQVTVDGRRISLTLKEFDLLVALAQEPDVVQRRHDLIARVWDANWIGSTRTLDVHIGSLRSKLGSRAMIQTIRGVGFRLLSDPRRAA